MVITVSLTFRSINPISMPGISICFNEASVKGLCLPCPSAATSPSLVEYDISVPALAFIAASPLPIEDDRLAPMPLANVFDSGLSLQASRNSRLTRLLPSICFSTVVRSQESQCKSRSFFNAVSTAEYNYCHPPGFHVRRKKTLPHLTRPDYFQIAAVLDPSLF